MSAVAPSAISNRASAWRVVEYNARSTRRWWRSLLVAVLFTPLTYVLALGVGLGVVIDRNGHGLGVPYLVFVAPAFLTASALQSAAADASFPVVAGFKWVRTFHGMAATPITPRQICDGTLLFILLRVLASSAVYLAIMATFGGTQRWQVIFAIPVAALTAIGFAGIVAAIAATVDGESGVFNLLFRFVVTPMFLFSGTFYPISQLPQWGRWLAYISPLWHGTQVARGAAIGHLPVAATIAHLAVLVVLAAVGLQLARWRFAVRLAK
jgi:lipooligosaccharide transport system permease protein